MAIVATGDELVELDEPMEAWQIRNSNSYALAALVEAAGGVGERLAIARDTLGELRAQVAEGREADLLLLSGGVSMGKYDLVEQVLREFRAEFFFTGALIQPGKPIVFGRLPRAKARDLGDRQQGPEGPFYSGSADLDVFLWAAGKSGVGAGLLCLVCGSDAARAGGTNGDCARVRGGSAGGGDEGWGAGYSVSAGGVGAADGMGLR